MKTKAQIITLAKRLNVTIEDNSTKRINDVTLFAPENYIFDSSSASVAVVSWFTGEYDKREFWQEVYNELTSGLTEEITMPNDQNWLADLADITTSAELVAIAKAGITKTTKRTTKATKPTKPTKRIAGETHEFKPLPTMKQHPPRMSPFFGTPPVFRKYESSQLIKAQYNPSHLMGMEPLLPIFGHLHMNHGDWI